MSTKGRRRVELPEALLGQFREWGRQGGRKRARKLEPERRQEIARKGGEARAAKRKKRK